MSRLSDNMNLHRHLDAGHHRLLHSGHCVAPKSACPRKSIQGSVPCLIQQLVTPVPQLASRGPGRPGPRQPGPCRAPYTSAAIGESSSSSTSSAAASLATTAKQHVARLHDALSKEDFASAVSASTLLKQMFSNVVNTKQSGLKSLQQSTVASPGCVDDLMQLARRGEPIAYEVLQILCYRNAVSCEQVAAAGVCEYGS